MTWPQLSEDRTAGRGSTAGTATYLHSRGDSQPFAHSSDIKENLVCSKNSAGAGVIWGGVQERVQEILTMSFPKQSEAEDVSDGLCAPPCHGFRQPPSGFARDMSSVWNALFLPSSFPA